MLKFTDQVKTAVEGAFGHISLSDWATKLNT